MILKQPYSAFNESKKFRVLKGSLLERYHYISIYSKLKELIIECENKQKTNGNSSEISNLIKYQKLYICLCESISGSLNNKIAFWNEINSINLSFNKLQEIGSKIISSENESYELITKLDQLHPHNVKSHILYAVYLHDIDDNLAQFKEEYSKVKSAQETMKISKSFWGELEQKFGANTQVGVLYVSSDPYEIGKILNCNDEMYSIAGYNKKDLVGRNINIFLPSFLRDSHLLLIKEYMENDAQLQVPMNKPKLLLHSDGYILQVNLFQKYQISISNDICMVFISKPKKIKLHNISEEFSKDVRY